MKKLPIYRAVFDEEKDDKMIAISFVDYPAIEVDWMAFAKQKKPMQFSVEDEDKHIVFGCIMRADYPIYRIGSSGYEYYIEFEKDTIRKMAQQYLNDGFQNITDTNHNHQISDGVYMQEMFIKDVENGVNPKGFEEIEDGSLFAKFKVENEELWQQIKEGTFKGFSIEIWCGSEEIQDPDEQEYQECVELINKINKKLNNGKVK